MPEWIGTDEELEEEMSNTIEWPEPIPCEVHHPEHYTAGGIEALDVLKAKLTPEEYQGYLKGNILKYLLRANFKGSHRKDVGKSVFYAEELLNATQETET